MRLSLFIVFLVIALILLTLEENEALRKRSPSKSRPPSRKPSTSRKKTPTRTRRPKQPKVVRPKIYKYTNMPVKTYSSPVILKQTTYKSKSSKYPKYLAAGAAGAITYYALTRAPVYRGYYPMYGSHLYVPRNRGIRVVEERQEIVNRYTSEKCYRVETTKIDDKTPNRDDDDRTSNAKPIEQLAKPINSTTTVSYDGDEENQIIGAKNISLDEDKIGKNFTAVTITDYAGDIPGTKISGNCTRVVTTTRASMIKVYDSNPYANAAFVEPTSSCVLIFTLVALCFKLLR